MLLFLGSRRFIPDLETTPDFSTPRLCPTKGSTQVLFGVTPFVFGPPEVVVEQPEMTAATEKGSMSLSDARLETQTLYDDTSMESPTSITSHESRRPLNYSKGTA